jgi:hypothetical protein
VLTRSSQVERHREWRSYGATSGEEDEGLCPAVLDCLAAVGRS